MTEWIKCSDRLPESNSFFDTYHENGDIRHDVTWDISNQRFEIEHEMGWIIPVTIPVTHWKEKCLPPAELNGESYEIKEHREKGGKWDD